MNKGPDPKPMLKLSSETHILLFASWLLLIGAGTTDLLPAGIVGFFSFSYLVTVFSCIIQR